MATEVRHDIVIPQTTVGISPKVVAFLSATWLPGLVLVVLGLVLGNELLLTVGLSLLGGGVAGGAAGYKAPPGAVPVSEVGTPNDALLGEASFHRFSA